MNTSMASFTEAVVPFTPNAASHTASLIFTLLAALLILVTLSSSSSWCLSSNEPVIVPYIIPILGHTIPFLRNSEALLTRARESFGNARFPFSLKLGGSTFYVITDPRDVSAVYNATKTLSFDIFLQKIMSEFGCKRTAIRRILSIPDQTGLSGRPRSVCQLAHDYQLKQTRGSELKELGRHIIHFFEENLLLETVQGGKLQNFYVAEDKVISLKAWTAQVFIHAGQDVYFGPKLLELNSNLPSDLMRLDELSWQVFYQYPRIFRRECEALSSRICKTLEQYFAIPREERKTKAWFTHALEIEDRRVGLDDQDIAAQMLFLYWGINTNVSKVGYWMVARAVFAPDLIDIIREETGPAFRADGSLDGDYVFDSRRCPRLNSFWLESLRLCASSTALRYVVEDTVIGGKTLKKGNVIMISARQLHFNTAPTAFGENASSFDPERFLGSKNLEQNPSFRPFGGGKTLCPGRHLAKYMTLAFVALVFRKFDVQLAGEQSFPRCEECKPAIGIISGKDDVLLTLKERNVGGST